MLLYKYRSFSNLHHISDILVHKRLFCAQWYRLNDPVEGLFLERGIGIDGEPTLFRGDVDNLYDVAEEECPRVCSLSSTPSSMRLWSLYADGHRGVAIEIDTNCIDTQPLQVRYTKGLPTHARTSVGHALSHKTRHWAYEREYRYVTKQEYITLGGSIKRVLFGVCLRKAEREVVQRLLPAGVFGIEMRLDRDRGELCFPTDPQQ